MSSFLTNPFIRLPSMSQPAAFQSPVSAGLVGSGAGGGGAAASTPSGGVATSIATLLASIPIAHDGDVFTPNHYNTMRDVMFALAAITGAALGPGAVATFPPQISDTGSGKWSNLPAQTDARGNAEGWLAVDLADGASLSGLTVINRCAAAHGSLTVELRRILLSDPDPAKQLPLTMASVTATGGDGTTVHTDSAPVLNEQFRGNAADELSRVDNSRYRYYIDAKATPANNQHAVKDQVIASIFTFQISYVQFGGA